MADDMELDAGQTLCKEATVKTKTSVRLFVLTRRDFRTLVQTSPSVERKVMKSLARRLVELSSDPALA